MEFDFPFWFFRIAFGIDNGIGFNNSGAATNGMGLVNLKLRVEAIKGKMEVESEAGSGVSAYLEFDTTVLEKELV